MSKNIITVILPLLLSSNLAFAANDSGMVEIYDFKQGLMRKHNGVYKVYNQGKEFQYHTNGECTYNHKQYNCMWYGFSFQTAQDVKKITLNCTSTLSSPDDIGNPQGVHGKQLENINYQLNLKGMGGYFSNPQYLIKEPNIVTQELTTTCSHNGKVMFKYNIITNFGA